MDTRNKILTSTEAVWAIPRPAVLVAGTFDVLRADHVRELEALRAQHPGSAVVAAVLPGNPVLPQRARAELAAALRAVDYVIPAELADAVDAAVAVNWESADAERFAELAARVRGKR